MQISLVLLSIQLLNCTVPLKNNKFYVNAPDGSSYWFMSLSKEQGQDAQSIWDKERIGMVCESPDVFANLKEIIETLCTNTGECSEDVQQSEISFFSKLNLIEGK